MRAMYELLASIFFVSLGILTDMRALDMRVILFLLTITFIAIASKGQESTQVSQPVHFSELTTAAMKSLHKKVGTKGHWQ